MKHFPSLESLAACVGQEIAVTDWVLVDQDMINRFADATDDHQWIHVDPERASHGPFGTTVAHGFLTLSLLPRMLYSAYEVGDARMAVNAGLNRVRFTAPVPAGSRLRARLVLKAADVVAGGQQLTWDVTMEREGSERPVCVAEMLGRVYV